MEDYLNPKQFGRLVGKSRITIWAWCRSGKLKSIFRRGKFLIPRDELLNFIQEREEVVKQEEAKKKLIEPRGRSRWFYKDSYYKDRADEQRQKSDVDYKAFRRENFF